MAIIKLPKEHLGLAAEFAVASELCRRNIYAQLTLGARKRTDLLVETESGMMRIQVKAKQGKEWPNCRGIYGQNIALVLVDFEKKREDQRPDFYILTSGDWRNLINGDKKLRDMISTGEIEIDEENVPVWVKQVGKSGRPYRGMGLRVSQVSAHKECWDKLGTTMGKG